MTRVTTDDGRVMEQASARLGRVVLALFALSTAFPVVAGFGRWAPRWLGAVDVAVAALLVVAAFAVVTRMRGRVDDRHRARAFALVTGVSSLIPVLLLVFFTVGDRVDWTVLVIGLSWRGWLFMQVVPSLVASLDPLERHSARTPSARITPH